MRRDRERLLDILEALDAIKSSVDGCDKVEFLTGSSVFGAVAYQLTIVGEAVSRLSSDLKGQHPSIMWRDIVSLRNLLIHAYFGIDRDLVWKVSVVDCPALHAQIDHILETLGD